MASTRPAQETDAQLGEGTPAEADRAAAGVCGSPVGAARHVAGSKRSAQHRPTRGSGRVPTHPQMPGRRADVRAADADRVWSARARQCGSLAFFDIGTIVCSLTVFTRREFKYGAQPTNLEHGQR